MPSHRTVDGGDAAEGARQPKACNPRVHHQERVSDAAAATEGADAVEGGDEADVLLGREVLVQAEQLRHVRDTAAGTTRELHRVLAEDLDLTRRPAQRSGQHADRGRLARSARPDDAEDRARGDIERHVVNGDAVPECARQPAGRDDRGAGGCRRLRIRGSGRPSRRGQRHGRDGTRRRGRRLGGHGILECKWRAARRASDRPPSGRSAAAGDLVAQTRRIHDGVAADVVVEVCPHRQSISSPFDHSGSPALEHLGGIAPAVPLS